MNRISKKEAAQGARFPRLDSLRPPHNDWVSRVKFNVDNGYVNEDLLVVLGEMTHWKVETERKPIYQVSKRLFDIVVSLGIFFLFLPLFVISAIAIRIESRGPVFFRQLRAGQFGRPFWIWKFRTMRSASSNEIHYLRPMEKPGSENLTYSVGRFLRNHKIDEFPQVWNVFKGDMSIVGPRPFSMNDTASITAKEYARFAVRPGLTGLWQATVPNNIDGKVKLRLDCEYIKRRCWKLDLYLLVKTIGVITRGENAFSHRFKSKRFNVNAKVMPMNGRKES